MKVCNTCGVEIMTREGDNSCKDCKTKVKSRKGAKRRRESIAAAMESAGLKRVKGAMGGVYWE